MKSKDDRIEMARREHDWNVLLKAEEAAFQSCCDLDSELPEKTEAKAEAIRHWWSVVNGILWMFTRTRSQFDHELQPFPVFTLARLANISEEISNGNIPSFVTDARKGGRPRWRVERHHIAYGVLYIEAAKRGEIDDRSFNKTVRRTYGVTARVVQNWMRDKDSICVGVPHAHLSPDELTEKMLECGEIYSKIGRGAPAEN